jgi:hypothetical protein
MLGVSGNRSEKPTLSIMYHAVPVEKASKDAPCVVVKRASPYGSGPPVALQHRGHPSRAQNAEVKKKSQKPCREGNRRIGSRRKNPWGLVYHHEDGPLAPPGLP